MYESSEGPARPNISILIVYESQSSRHAGEQNMYPGIPRPEFLLLWSMRRIPFP